MRKKKLTQKTRKRLNLWAGCPHCQMAVYPDDDGCCPFCGFKLDGYSKEANEKWAELEQLRQISSASSITPQQFRFMIGDF